MGRMKYVPYVMVAVYVVAWAVANVIDGADQLAARTRS